MRIVTDEKIPYLREALEIMGHTVTPIAGNEISRSDLMNTEALFVRTRTHCDASLLENTAVRFIGTATIGHDHIDKEYCRKNGITWTNAPGCNADAVLQYVQCCIYCWMKNNDIRSTQGLTIGIVGVGQIGSRVQKWAQEVGFYTLLNDPPRASQGENGFVDLDEITQQCDIITFHPTLSRDGDHPSYHLADSEFMNKLHKCRLLINASRGPVVDNTALLEALNKKIISSAAIDVWENEPLLNQALLDKSFIATPHIAGYSAEGKMNASRMVLEAFAQFSGYKKELPVMQLPAPLHSRIYAATQADALLDIYNPLNDTRLLKSTPEKFEELRNNYALRREPSAYKIEIKEH